MTKSEWKNTPLWLQLFGKPAYRRWVEFAGVGGWFGEWEYSAIPKR